MGGQRHQQEPGDPTYVIKLADNLYSGGLRRPKRGKGLGSYVNREDRSQPRARKSCIIIYDEIEDVVIIEMSNNLKAGCELFSCYSRGHRIQE
ncbi:TPA: hypothetical protein N0F65_002752 [Lagenidium giganteum]|uniref:Uncharacterized protein n=1 Tax=Lagenidium giganteum TaxID=4803 RepID=A0AAV2YM79_9STRA|nr:TPA: hypothetical protein N0F65_002752 [Lagenidium giganteum]